MRIHRLSLSLVLVALVCLAAAGCGSSDGNPALDMAMGPPPHPAGLDVPSPVWEEQVVYFVVTDRFANGDKSNDDQKKGEFDPANIDKYSGGDIQGLIDRLDYIQGLGATALWITPPVANMWWDPLQQSGGYHGYWARDLSKVDEHLGTLESYQKLSVELHKRGMYLIQDVVPNHMGNFFQYGSYDANDVSKGFVKNSAAVPGGKPDQAPFDRNDATSAADRAAAIYHFTPAISDYNDRNQELNYQISDLDDLNTENPVVQTALKKSYGDWIRNVGVDAFRVDTAKFVDHPFWNDFFQSSDGIMATAKATGRSDFFAFGEVYEIPAPLDDTLEKKVASYLGTKEKPELPALLGFPLYGEIGRVFATGKPTSYLSYRLAKFTDTSLYPNYFRTPTFIDNHDVQRFLSASTEPALAQALDFLFTIPGIPIVYYGTEQKFVETRQAMFAGGFKSPIDHFDVNTALYKRIKKLADLRRGSKTLTHGTLSVLYDSEAGAGALGYARELMGDKVLVLMNTADENVLVSKLDTGLPEGAIVEMLHAEQGAELPKVGIGGKLTAVLPGRAVIIARPTGKTEVPAMPGATITVDTPIEGKTFADDVVFTGKVTPADAKVWMILDGYYDRAVVTKTPGDGTFTVTLPVSGFPTGTARHAVAFWSPAAQASTERFKFTTQVVFKGTPIEVMDPTGDDTGPMGKKYGYPTDKTFAHQGDITAVRVEPGPTTMAVIVTMKEMTAVWNPPNGFDHVAFNLFLSVPGKSSAMALPKLNATFPGGGSWSHQMFSYGWFSPAMFGSDGGSLPGPALTVDAKARTVTFTFDRRSYGVASWSGTRIYLTSWDFDGIKGVLRPLSMAGGQWEFSGGGPMDPLILDDVPLIAVP